MSFKLPLFASLCGLALSTATASQAQSVGVPIAPPFTISQTESGSVIATASPNSVSGVAGALAVTPSAIGVLSAVTASNTTYNQIEKGTVTSQIVAPTGSATNSLMIENPRGTVTLAAQAIGTQNAATGSEGNVVFNQSLVGSTVQAINNVTVTNGAVIKDQTVAFGNSFGSTSSSGTVKAVQYIDSASKISTVDNLNVTADKSNLVVQPAAYGNYASLGTAAFGAGAMITQPLTQTNADRFGAIAAGCEIFWAGANTSASAIGNLSQIQIDGSWNTVVASIQQTNSGPVTATATATVTSK
jgi:hypothetical protein